MIILDNRHINKLKETADDEYLSCGVVVGFKENGNYIVADLIEMENEASENKNKRFLLSPLLYQQAELFAEEKKLQVLGFYYSSAIKENSEPEIKHALPGVIYISSAGDEIKAWQLSENRRQAIYYNIEVRPDVYNLATRMAIAV